MTNPSSKKVNCPRCGALVEPKESDTPAGTLLICPECTGLIGWKKD